MLQGASIQAQVFEGSDEYTSPLNISQDIENEIVAGVTVGVEEPVSPGTTLKLCLLAVLCGSFTTPFSATATYQVYCPV